MAFKDAENCPHSTLANLALDAIPAAKLNVRSQLAQHALQFSLLGRVPRASLL